MEEIVYKERRGTDCVKWDGLAESFGEKDLTALWVADMDFQAPACVRQALREYVEMGAYGYYRRPDSHYEPFMRWEKQYHGYEVKKEWLRFAPGVVPAIYWLVQMLTEPGDGVGVMTPVYYPFMNAVKDNGRIVTDCPLINRGGAYTMDLERLERLASEGAMKLFILCSPHNPVGRVWLREELKAFLAVCGRYRIPVIADEIHQDIVFEEREQTALGSLGEYEPGLVTLTAPSKTFNLASMQNSVVVLPDEELRGRWDEFTRRLSMNNGNAMGYIAAASAYEGGRPWLEGVLKIIRGNYEYLRQALSGKLPQAQISPLEGTYLSWVNLEAYVQPGRPAAEWMKETVQEKARLAVDFGDWFGGPQYASFIRMNLATRRENIEQAADRLAGAIR